MIKYFIIAIVVSLLVPFILNISLLKKPKCDDENVIKPSDFPLFLGCVLIAIFIFVCIIFFVQKNNESIADNYVENDFEDFLILGGTVLLSGICLILYWRNWRIYLGEEELEFTNILGIKRTYKYSEIIEITTHYDKSRKYIEQYKICLKKRKISVDMFLVNFDKFERVIKKRMKKNRV